MTTDHKELVRRACSVARLSLVHVTEDRPRVALETVEAWCDGKASDDEVRRAAEAIRSWPGRTAAEGAAVRAIEKAAIAVRDPEWAQFVAASVARAEENASGHATHLPTEDQWRRIHVIESEIRPRGYDPGSRYELGNAREADLRDTIRVLSTHIAGLEARLEEMEKRLGK